MDANAMFRFSPNPNSAHRIHWIDWSPAAFDRARDEKKPVMLYLGAFWCGVCQRMDETTFSATEVIALLNAYFVPVRVEDAQRPDIDVRYNRNGWPTIVFLSAEGDYLAGVNHLSPRDFSDVLVRVHVGCRERQPAAAPDPAATGLAEPETATSEPPGSTPAEPGSSAPDSSAGPPSADKPPPGPLVLGEITETVRRLADPVHGGYETDRKFPHCAANEFLLLRYQATGDARYLNHVRLTLYNMHQSKTHDPEGGFFRYSSKRDWSEPHHEKLLSDHAGLLDNALHVFELTGEAFFRELAEEILDYLDRGFDDPAEPYYHGCRDYIRITPGRDRPPGSLLHKTRGMFSITDPWMYTDANARAVSALLRAAGTLERKDCLVRALETLRFLLERCWDGSRGMAHYFDDAPRLRGLLTDQALMGRALAAGFEATGEAVFLERAEGLAGFIRTRLKNPAGGFFDIAEKGPAFLRYPLTLVDENGAAARLFLKLFDLTGKPEHREAARWALKCFTGDFTDHGVHAAEYATALAAYAKA